MYWEESVRVSLELFYQKPDFVSLTTVFLQ